MRQIFLSTGIAAMALASPAIGLAQDAGSGLAQDTSGLLRQSVTIIDDPFADARVPVRPPAFAQPRQAETRREQPELTLEQETSQRVQTQSSRSVFDRGADLEPAEDSALAFSGFDSINREAQDRRRLSLLAATGQLPAEPADPVPPRLQPEADPYAALGIRRGSFILFPELELGGVYSSNVASISPSGPDDFGLRVAPRIALRSDWSRHALSFEAQSESIFWDEFEQQNVNNASLAISGRVDIRSTTTLDLSAGLGLSQSTVSDIEVPDQAQSPREDLAYNVLARLTHQMGRIVAQATAAATWFKFGDVNLGALGIEDNDDRDYVAPSGGLRIGYLMSEALQPFAEVTYSPRIHDQKLDRNGLNRDSHGVVVRAGLSVNDGAKWSGEVAARYEYRDYEDALLNNQSALGMDANLTWTPTEITSIVLSAASQIEESSDPLVSGATTWSAGAVVTHQLRDNLTAEAGVSVGSTDYDGIADETTIGTSLGFAYAIHREIQLIAGYEFTAQNPGEASGYEEHRLSTGVRFQL
jgi:hypothetical protein